MRPLLSKPRQVPAVVTPCDSQRPLIQPGIDLAGISLRVEAKPAKGHKMPFAYCPGPTSVILLKMMVMENYSANTDRLARQREFCSRVKVS